MAIAYFDCFAGAGGDMIVAALIDAGADFQALQAELAKLDVAGYSLRAEKVRRGGLAAVKFDVAVELDDQPARRLADVLALIDGAGLAPRAGRRAGAIFTRLAEAEAKVHDVDVNNVHFHEVGAVDSIMDVVGACAALELLDVDRVFCSPIPLGSGTVACRHGTLPVPAPATAELMKGARTADSDLQGELTTPTAAATLTTLAEGYGPAPAMDVSAVGYGAGDREGGKLPNLLRVLIGRGQEDGTADAVVELSANIDDCTGQIIAAALGKLLSAGCLDAWAAPIVMKKSRPAWLLSALCRPADLQAAEEIIFTETTTFGLRRRLCERSKLARTHETVETAYGPIRVKIGLRDRQVVTAAPEFSDCLSAAEAHHVPVKEVLRAAETAYRKGKRA